MRKVSPSAVSCAAWNSLEGDFLNLLLIGVSKSAFKGEGEVETSSNLKKFLEGGEKCMFLETRMLCWRMGLILAGLFTL